MKIDVGDLLMVRGLDSNEEKYSQENEELIQGNLEDLEPYWKDSLFLVIEKHKNGWFKTCVVIDKTETQRHWYYIFSQQSEQAYRIFCKANQK